jgi:hypothetical protein
MGPRTVMGTNVRRKIKRLCRDQSPQPVASTAPKTTSTATGVRQALCAVNKSRTWNSHARRWRTAGSTRCFTGAFPQECNGTAPNICSVEERHSRLAIHSLACIELT